MSAHETLPSPSPSPSQSPDRSPTPPTPPWVLAVWFVAIPHLTFLALFVVSALQDEVPRKDWYAFWLAAHRAVEGGLSTMYVDIHSSSQRYIYPPFAVLFYAPLALVGPSAGYLMVVAAQIACIAAAIRLLGASFPVDRVRFRALLLAFVASAPFAYEVILGQNAGSFLLVLVGAAALLHHRRPLAAGVVLSLLAIKPHWLFAPMGLMLLFERRAFASLVLSVAGLAGLGFVQGAAPWVRFVEIAAAQAHHTGDVEGGRHNITLRGTLVGVLGPGNEVVIDRIWMVAVALATPALLWGWTRPISAWRKMSMLTLFVVALNLYVNSYDAVVLLFPLVDLVYGSDPVRPGARRVVLGLLALSWLVDVAGYMYPLLFGTPYPPFTTDGLVALVWLGALLDGARLRPLEACPDVSPGDVSYA